MSFLDHLFPSPLLHSGTRPHPGCIQYILRRKQDKGRVSQATMEPSACRSAQLYPTFFQYRLHYNLNHLQRVQTKLKYLSMIKVFRNFPDVPLPELPHPPLERILCSSESCQACLMGAQFWFSSLFFFLFLLFIIIFIMAVCNFLGGQWEEVGGFNLTNRPGQLVPLVVGIFEIN